MKYIILCLLLTGCVTILPNGYNQYVYINSGPYSGNRGKLVGDCKSFETYRVVLNTGKKVCVKVWHMERD